MISVKNLALEFNIIFNQKANKNDSNIKCTCEQPNIVIDPISANKICANCGVLICKIYTDMEWRNYGYSNNQNDVDNNENARCGQPIDRLLPLSSMTIRTAPIRNKFNKYVHLVRLQNWNMIHPSERSNLDVFNIIDNIFSRISTPISNSAIIEAKEYYKILSAKDDKKRGTLTRGDIRKALIAVCVIVACNNHKSPVQIHEIANICKITKPDITKGFKKFSKLEKDKNIQLNRPNVDHSLIHCYIFSFCNKLNFPEQLQDIAHILCERLPKLNLLKDTNDVSVCAGLLYFLSTKFFDCDIKKTAILDVIKTSTVTLQNVYNVLVKHQEILLIGLICHINHYKAQLNKSVNNSHVHYGLFTGIMQ